MSAVSHREIAAACGCSTATVSRALAGSPLVGPTLRRRVRAAAKKAGYRRNALVGALMAQVRRERAQSFSGNLAMIELRVDGERPPPPFHGEVTKAARDRARALGFHLDVIEFGAPGSNHAGALHRVLQARGIAGLLFQHSRVTAELRDFPWDAYSCVELDYCLTDPILHTILLDHHLTLAQALGRLRVLGYRRIGLFIENFKDAPFKFKWRGAFRAFQEGGGEIGDIPVHAAEAIQERAFIAWVRRHEPDLVVGHVDRAVGWLKAAGRRVPKDVGFFNLNWNERTLPCAGLDLCPADQGVVAAEVVIAQIHRNERGLPRQARTTMVTGRWVDGPTVRGAKGSRADSFATHPEQKR